MQWLVLGNWILVALLALPAASMAFSIPWLGVQAPLVLAGLVTVILFAANGSVEYAWVAAGFAALGSVALAAGARVLVSSSPRAVQLSQSREENVAMVVGLELPFLVTAILISALATQV